MSRTLFSLAGFQVILIGRFWVIAEERSRFPQTVQYRGFNRCPGRWCSVQ